MARRTDDGTARLLGHGHAGPGGGRARAGLGRAGGVVAGRRCGVGHGGRGQVAAGGCVNTMSACIATTSIDILGGQDHSRTFDRENPEKISKVTETRREARFLHRRLNLNQPLLLLLLLLLLSASSASARLPSAVQLTLSLTLSLTRRPEAGQGWPRRRGSLEGIIARFASRQDSAVAFRLLALC